MHKDLGADINLVKIAETFASTNSRRQRSFIVKKFYCLIGFNSVNGSCVF